MKWASTKALLLGFAATTLFAATGCRNHMPHAFTWPAGGDVVPSHPKPPEGGYYSNWDPYAVSLEVTPVEDVNPVRTQHYLVATVKDKDGQPLPNRRIEWIVNSGSVGDIVEVDESGWRASRGYVVDNHRAVSHTNQFSHVLDMGDSDPSNDIQLSEGQTWCVVTSPIEGDTYVTVYAPGIYDTSKHKVFAVKHWYDVKWDCPPAVTKPTGSTHEFIVTVSKFSDGTPLEGYQVNYTITDGPAASLSPTGTAVTDGAGQAKVTISQGTPAEGTNNLAIEIIRPANIQCCKPAVRIATCNTAITWIGPKIACNKTGPSNVMAGEPFDYSISVSNPSQVDATNVVVTDSLPNGLAYESSNPSASAGGNSLTWNLGTVAPGATQMINVRVKATTTGRFENCAEVRADQGLSSRCCATTVATSPALVLEKRCPAEVTICDPIEYVVVVRNSGDGPARNVKIEDRLPDGIVTTSGQSVVNATIEVLGPGESKEVRFTAKASRTGSFTNPASATADGGLSAQASCTTVVKQPMLAVTKTGPDMRYIGRPAEYDITVRNTGDSPAVNTVLTDPIPAGTEFVSATENGSMSGGTCTWNLGTIEPGGTRSVKITLRARTAGSAKNQAFARAICTEANAEVMTQIKGVPAILLECVDLSDPIEVGANETYVITVTNQGSAEDTNIVIECILPDKMDYVSGDGPVQVTAEGKKVTFAPLPSLAPKAKATYRVITKGTAEGDLRFKITLKSDQTESVVEETESTHVY